MMWTIREDYPEGSKPQGPSLNTDIAVPVSAVTDFLGTAGRPAAGGADAGGPLAVHRPCGDGNIHLSLHAPAGWAGDRAAWVERAAEMEPLVNAIAVSLGGSFSAEHGIGQSKRHAMATHKPAGCGSGCSRTCRSPKKPLEVRIGSGKGGMGGCGSPA